MTNVAALIAVNQHRWDMMHIHVARLPVLHARAAVLCAAENKARFQGVTDRLAELAANDTTIYPVPWWFVAIVSEREYGGPPRWDRQFGQGDPLHQKSIRPAEALEAAPTLRQLRVEAFPAPVHVTFPCPEAKARLEQAPRAPTRITCMRLVVAAVIVLLAAPVALLISRMWVAMPQPIAEAGGLAAA